MAATADRSDQETADGDNRAFRLRSYALARIGLIDRGLVGPTRALQTAALLCSYAGWISILDGVGLEAQKCRCYFGVRNRYDRLLGGAAWWRRARASVPARITDVLISGVPEPIPRAGLFQTAIEHSRRSKSVHRAFDSPGRA